MKQQYTEEWLHFFTATLSAGQRPRLGDSWMEELATHEVAMWPTKAKEVFGLL